MTTQADLIRGIEALGYRAGMVPIGRMEDLESALNLWRRDGIIGEDFFAENLSGFVFSPPEDLPGAKSIVVVAIPDDPVHLWFDHRGERKRVIIPPHYLHCGKKDRAVGEALSATLSTSGFRAVKARLPVKLLAVSCGLARYGRNNITYIDGLGSFHRLVSFFTDLECSGHEWRKPVAMESCSSCTACARSCPSGAIDPGRFLVRAERCITLWNEMPEDVPFPDWLEPSWHNSLVGCMRCQEVCPANGGNSGRFVEGAVFSEKETEMLLGGTLRGEMPISLIEKLEAWDLLESLEMLPRNLAPLLGSAGKET